MQNHQKDKLKYLRSIVIRSIQAQKKETDNIFEYLTLVDILTASHIQALMQFKRHSSSMINHRPKPPIRDFGDLNNLIGNDLVAKYLIKSTKNIGDDEAVEYTWYRTAHGDNFLNFIKKT